MEPTNNDNEYLDDDIRPPDPVIRERLVDYGDDDFTDYNYSYLEPEPDLDQIMQKSLEEFEISEMQKVQEMLANNIFKLIKTIRLTKEEVILLEGLFVSN
jgi:hypothetical protein